MVNLGNAPINGVFELTNKEFLSPATLKNHNFVELLYGQNFRILAPDTPLGDSGSRLDYTNDDSDSQMSDTTIHTASLTL